MKVGIDLVEHKDFVGKKRLAEKFLVAAELEQLAKINSPKRQVEYLASRWAVKEAIIKCYEGEVGFLDITIYNKKNGACFALVKNHADKLQISLSHTDNYSVAIAILPPLNDVC